MTDTKTLAPEIESQNATQTRTKELATRDNPTAQCAVAHKSQFPIAGYESAEIEAIVVLTIGAMFILGVVFQLSPLNGSERLTHWEWPWRNDIGILRATLFFLMPFIAIEEVLRRTEKQSDLRVPIYLGVLTLANFLLQIMGILADPRGMALVQQIVASPSATSYFSDAARIRHLAALFRQFDQLTLNFHSSTHPPGPIVFYYLFLKLFGAQTAALVGGLVVGALGSLGVAVTYGFAGLWTENRRTRMIAGALYALLPALVVFFPEMDQIYPILAMLLILCWCKSLKSTGRFPREALYLGATLSVALFFAYNLTTIGAFLALYGLYWLWRQEWASRSVITALRNLGIAVGLCVLVYSVLWLVTGYNPIASFRSALAHQSLYAAMLHRASPLFAILDPYDFFLGTGILALPLMVFLLCRMVPNFDLGRPEFALTLIGVATILTIDLTGILRAETARVWLFLQPLVIVPVPLELSRFRGRWLLALFWMQWLIVVCLKAKMSFVNP